VENSTSNTNEDLDKPIWGVESFAKIINRTPRQTHHLVAKGRIPGVKKVGARFVSTKRKLLAAVLDEDA
jgi:hypothetical protein